MFRRSQSLHNEITARQVRSGILRAYRLDLRRNRDPGLRGTSQGNAATGRSAREFVLTPWLDIRGRFSDCHIHVLEAGLEIDLQAELNDSHRLPQRANLSHPHGVRYDRVLRGPPNAVWLSELRRVECIEQLGTELQAARFT